MLKELLEKASSKYPFGTDDFVQQVIGGALLTSPFLFTEEVWKIAANTSIFQSLVSVGMALALGHGILYVAHQERDWENERKIAGVTVRYISLMAVSFGTIVLMLAVSGATETFGAGIIQTLQVISLVSIFAVIGAATADSLI